MSAPRHQLAVGGVFTVLFMLCVALVGCVSTKHDIPGWPKARSSSGGCPDLSGTYFSEGRTPAGSSEGFGLFLTHVSGISGRWTRIRMGATSGLPFSEAGDYDQVNRKTVTISYPDPDKTSVLHFNVMQGGRSVGETTIGGDCGAGSVVFQGKGSCDAGIGVGGCKHEFAILFPGEDGSLIGKRYIDDTLVILVVPISSETNVRWTRWTRAN